MTNSLPAQPSAYVQVYRNFYVDDENLRNILTAAWVEHSNGINLREIGIYDLVEQVNGQQFFDPNNAQRKRFGFRKVFNIGAIAAGATFTVAHGITGVSSFTQIYGTAVTTSDSRPIPFVSTAALNQQVSLRIVGANIEIINGAAAPNITSAIVTLDYLKQ